MEGPRQRNKGKFVLRSDILGASFQGSAIPRKEEKEIAIAMV
jgi:hypothetical protein